MKSLSDFPPDTTGFDQEKLFQARRRYASAHRHHVRNYRTPAPSTFSPDGVRTLLRPGQARIVTIKPGTKLLRHAPRGNTKLRITNIEEPSPTKVPVR